jgi:two-component system, chemotaxis family, response regulator PixG
MSDRPILGRLTAQHLQGLKANLFTGRLVIAADAGQRWDLYFYLGRILYAKGGHHAMRRWLRYLSLHCLSASSDPYQSQNFQYFTDVSGLQDFEIFTCWEYFILRDCVQNAQLSRERVGIMMQEIVQEILFDIQQAHSTVQETIAEDPLKPQLALFEAAQLWQTASRSWDVWKDHKLRAVFPDRAAVISRSARLRQEISPAAYMALDSLLDGKRSLREISAKTGRHVIEVAASLWPYIEAGNITLVEVPDLIDPAERYFSTYSQSGTLLEQTSRDTIRNAARPQDITQRTRIAG